MISLIDILSALTTALRGIRHSISTATMTTDATRTGESMGTVSSKDVPSPDSTIRRISYIGPLIHIYRRIPGTLPRIAYVTFSSKRMNAVSLELNPRLLSVPIKDILSATILSQIEKVMNITRRNATAKRMKRSPKSSSRISFISSVIAKRMTLSLPNSSLSISSAASICESSTMSIISLPGEGFPQERTCAVSVLTTALFPLKRKFFASDTTTSSTERRTSFPALS